MGYNIRFDNVYKAYDGKEVVKGVNLSIDEGAFVTMIGSSGSGKTTLLKMINGLVMPDKGSIYVKERSISEWDIIQLRRSIGYSIQGNVLFPHMTIEENIAYVPNLIYKNNKDMTKDAVEKWIKIVELDKDILNRYPDELSGGQQQRVGIARSLAASPELLLMDEPFGSVDEITRRQLQLEIKRIHNETGITIVFVTHDIYEAMLLGTKVIVMHNGELQQYGSPEDVMVNPETEYVEKLIDLGNRCLTIYGKKPILKMNGGEFGFDGDLKSEAASRCRQAT